MNSELKRYECLIGKRCDLVDPLTGVIYASQVNIVWGIAVFAGRLTSIFSKPLEEQVILNLFDGFDASDSFRPLKYCTNFQTDENWEGFRWDEQRRIRSRE